MSTLRLAALALVLVIASACNIGAPDTRPLATDEILVLAPTLPSPSPRTSATPEPPTAAAVKPTVEIAIAAPSVTPPPPTTAASATATSPYFEYEVQPGESLFYILLLPQHGYGYEADVAAAVVALNDNIINADNVPVGQTILIPRPTATSTAVGAQATQALLATIGVDDNAGAVLPSGSIVSCHEVKAGETMVDIAVKYNTTLEVLSSLNRDVNWFGCRFTEPSGGPDCAPNINIDQCVRVPLPTPFPTKYPTPTGNETITPTATKLAPRLLYPSQGEVIPPGGLTLQWVGLSGMDEADTYLIELIDQTSNLALRQVTDSNAYRVPDEAIPGDGSTHLMQWFVTVARQDSDGRYYYVGAPGEPRTFQWQSR